MVARLILAIVVLALVVAPIAGVMVATPASATTNSCGQGVEYTEFRSAAAVDSMNQTGDVTASRDNTEVTVEEATGFIRLRADNPNGYCVRFVVEIGQGVVAPADLGTIASNDDEVEASWRASQNLSSSEVYTRVTFTLNGNSSATFAPSKMRVQSLSWTGTAKSKASGAAGVFQDFGLESLLGDDKLEQRTYEIEPTSSSSRITIPLQNGGREIEDWHATYTYEGTTRPISQSADAPVFYTESDGAVTFHFNEETASVEFTAEPTKLERLEYSADSYFSGTPFNGLLDGILGTTTGAAV